MRNKAWRGSTATAAIAAALLAALATPAVAATATANLGVTATVSNNCTISTTAVGFGSYDPVVAHASTNLDGTGTVIVACTKGAVATVGLGLGSNVTGSTRRLKDPGTNYLTYELYRDAGRTSVWGDAGAALLSPGAAPSKTARTFTVYGRIPQNQDIPAGAYTDTVVATVNF